MIKFCWQNVEKLSHLHVFKMGMAYLWKGGKEGDVTPSVPYYWFLFQQFCPFLNLRHHVFFYEENQVYLPKSKDLI